jgi:hypothetical protein
VQEGIYYGCAGQMYGKRALKFDFFSNHIGLTFLNEIKMDEEVPLCLYLQERGIFYLFY